jgi:site-specific DNA-methyltransferase (cytosine-N4-specific)
MDKNKVHFKSSVDMVEVDDNSISLIITSPPYFNIKDYSKDGNQKEKHSEVSKDDLGSLDDYKDYINSMLSVWKECERVLVPNGKLVINTPLMPMLKKDMNTHYNRHIFNINTDIESSIKENTGLYLMDLYIWNRTNSSKKLMFGSYPYPSNFYAQNTSEFINIFVKDGDPIKKSDDVKTKSKLTKEEWIEYTKQIWNITIPGKGDKAFGKHSAIMPEEIVRRCVKLYSFVDDIVMDPFCGSGTTLKVSKELDRNYIGYEVYKTYEEVIREKLGLTNGESL